MHRCSSLTSAVGARRSQLKRLSNCFCTAKHIILTFTMASITYTSQVQQSRRPTRHGTLLAAMEKEWEPKLLQQCSCLIKAFSLIPHMVINPRPGPMHYNPKRFSLLICSGSGSQPRGASRGLTQRWGQTVRHSPGTGFGQRGPCRRARLLGTLGQPSTCAGSIYES